MTDQGSRVGTVVTSRGSLVVLPGCGTPKKVPDISLFFEPYSGKHVLQQCRVYLVRKLSMDLFFWRFNFLHGIHVYNCVMVLYGFMWEGVSEWHDQ